MEKSKMQISLDERKLTNWRIKGKRKVNKRVKLTEEQKAYNKEKRKELKRALEVHRVKGLIEIIRDFPALKIEVL